MNIATFAIALRKLIEAILLSRRANLNRSLKLLSNTKKLVLIVVVGRR